MTEPAYDELPELGNLGVRHAWDVLPAPLGTLSRIAPEEVVAAAGLVRTGQVFPLNLGLDAFDPPLFGRAATAHRVFPHDRNTFEDTLESFNPQASSQWDGLGHVRAREHGWFGGRTDQEQAVAELGIQHWAAHGIVGRGVLLDVAAHRERSGTPYDPFGNQPVTADDLATIAGDAGVELRRGDVLVLRFGWTAEYRRRLAAGDDMPSVVTSWAGLSGSESTARFLWDNGIAAVAVDNPAVERGPGAKEDGSLHRRLIPALGFALAELLDLEALAAACAAQDRADFLFVGVPLPIAGGVSSPSNAVALL
ncbi:MULTISPECIES: cyclase family protein [unclassified Pseudonocardia]|uniref:cyclase family protein n=1 Tax=unclassified Pseudonocardia TaxID=2619320 RepID=UPI0001FFEEA1|nr:cyclase family protein [Pseudonocardia sp. Ae707_Ps1]OLM09241.1 Cyclase family protein [Pseudonocardia sp. Ae707_Ps1]